MQRKICILLVGALLFAGSTATAVRAQEEPPVVKPHPKPKPVPKPLPKPAASAILLLACDLACAWTLDGDAQERIDAGRMGKIAALPGQHVVQVSTEDSKDRVVRDVTLEANHQTLVRIDLAPVRNARLSAEETQRKEAEHQQELARQQQEEARKRSEAQKLEDQRLAELRAHAEENYKTGDGYFEKADYANALPYYSKACEGGYAPGCGDEGLIYFAGYKVTVDYKRAVALFQQGCDGDYLWACSNLGKAYKDGNGVAANPTRARELFQKACNGKLGTGCRYLGKLYEDGTGVAKDRIMARYYYQLGCNQKDNDSCTALNALP